MAPFFDEIVNAVHGCITDDRGLDAQLSNWAWTAEGLGYYDISTPFLRDENGNDLFDVELHVASVPWALRWAVRRFAIGSILDKFYTVRGAVLDLAGNLYKERMGAVVPTLLRIAESVVTPPITEREAAAYYRGDARLWALLQRLRRADRWWQRTVRRRTLPLPPARQDRPLSANSEFGIRKTDPYPYRPLCPRPHSPLTLGAGTSNFQLSTRRRQQPTAVARGVVSREGAGLRLSAGGGESPRLQGASNFQPGGWVGGP